MKLSLATEIFRKTPLEEAYEQIASMGYGAVGIHTRRALDPHVFPGRCRGGELKRLKRALASNGLEAACIRGFANTACSEGMAQLREELALAAELQCRVVQLTAPEPKAPLRSIEQMKAFREQQAQRLRAAAQEAENAQVTLCVEAHPGAFFESSIELGELLRLADHAGARFTLCTAHVVAMGETLDSAFDAAGDLVGYVNLADATRGVHHHLPLGQADVNFARLTELLAAEEYDGYLEVDLEAPADDPVPPARQSFEYMKKLL